MSKFKTIAFPTGGIIPADQAKKKSEQRPGPHVPVEVATDYADYLVGDRLAYEWSKDTAPPVPSDTSADAIIVAARAEAQRIVDSANATATTEKTRILDEAATEKDRVLSETATEKQRILDRAATEAEEIRVEARRAAEQIAAEAKAAADGIVADAEAKAADKGSAGKSGGEI